MHSSNLSVLTQKQKLSEIKYCICIFVFFLFRFFIFRQSRDAIFSPSVAVYYVLSYEEGFILRAFIGSIIALFTDYLTNDVLRVVISAITILLFALISVLIGKIINRTEQEYKSPVILFVLLLLVAPLSHMIFVETHFGRLDTFLLLFTLVALTCLKQPYLKWFIPILCFAAVATHPGYMVTYMPALAIPLLYEVYRSNFSKKSIVLFSTCCLILISFFIYFQYLSPQVNFSNAEEFGAYLSQHTDMNISNTVLYAEYFSPYLGPGSGLDAFYDYELLIAKNIFLPTIATYLAFTFPLIIIFAVIWKTSIRSTVNKFLKFIFFLCAVAPLAFIPAAVFAHDWERWWAAAINCQFIFIFYFIFSDEKPLKDSLKKICIYFEKHTFILLCLFTFFSSLMLSNICLFSTTVIDKNIFFDFFDKVLSNFKSSLEYQLINNLII